MALKKGERTRIRMIHAMEKLLETKPYQEITVSMITEQCEVTRQVFYKYFTDKEDLCYQMNVHFFDSAIRLDNSFTWEEMATHILTGYLSHKRFYIETSLVEDRDMLFRITLKQTLHVYHKMIEYRQGAPLDSKLEMILQAYCVGGINLNLDWIYRQMDLPVEEVVELFYRLMPPEIKELLTGFRFPKELTAS